MAQWNGQYSGLTHDTKVQDLEESLRTAAKSLTAATREERADKAKSVQRLAERLLAARLKATRARISEMKTFLTSVQNDQQGARLQKREEELNSEGIEGILKEFGVLLKFPNP